MGGMLSRNEMGYRSCFTVGGVPHCMRSLVRLCNSDDNACPSTTLLFFFALIGMIPVLTCDLDTVLVPFQRYTHLRERLRSRIAAGGASLRTTLAQPSSVLSVLLFMTSFRVMVMPATQQSSLLSKENPLEHDDASYHDATWFHIAHICGASRLFRTTI